MGPCRERDQLPVPAQLEARSPAFVDDAEASGASTITLSYTFFETELDSQAALGQTTTDAGVN